jgi:hypothetical protein
MANEPSMDKAHQAIGAYFCAFSELERELGEALKVVLRLQKNPAADTIVRIVQDFRRKASVVQAAITGAKNRDGTDPSSEWKTKANKTMEEILGCNNPDRTDLAHDYLEPHTDGSVSLQKPGQEQRHWAYDELDGKVQKVKRLTEELRTLRNDLTTLTIRTILLGESDLSAIALHIEAVRGRKPGTPTHG